MTTSLPPADPPAVGIPASLATSVSPAIAALRWGAVGYGVAVVAPGGTSSTWADVAALAVCVFLTTLRTLMPLPLERADRTTRAVALADVVVFSLAAGWTGGTDSPWAFCAMTAVAIAAFGWGTWMAVGAGVAAIASVLLGTAASGSIMGDLADSSRDVAVVFTMAVAATAGAYVRSKLSDAEERARTARTELDRLRSANDLLSDLADVALTLPGSFTLREALNRSRQQIDTFLQPRVTALFTLDEHNDEWTPKLADRCALRATYPREDLAPPLKEVLASGRAVMRSGDLGGDAVGVGSNSGMYLPLRARDRLIGLLAVEHPEPDHFDGIDPALRDGLVDVIALSIDNARWFGRLRTLGAEEERIRVARDVHDRLGQWMTYMKLELERLSQAPTVGHDEIERLHDDAATALDELRETLRQLRTGVSDDRPLAVLGRDLVDRFADRTDVATRFVVEHPDQRLPVPIENELLRILQEALNNVDRHAKARHVEVHWTVDGGNFELVVADDGRGFDPSRAVREQAYGLVGMRERAEVIGAALRIESAPDAGTRVVVSAGAAPAAPGFSPSPGGLSQPAADNGPRST